MKPAKRGGIGWVEPTKRVRGSCRAFCAASTKAVAIFCAVCAICQGRAPQGGQSSADLLRGLAGQIPGHATEVLRSEEVLRRASPVPRPRPRRRGGRPSDAHPPRGSDQPRRAGGGRVSLGTRSRGSSSDAPAIDDRLPPPIELRTTRAPLELLDACQCLFRRGIRHDRRHEGTVGDETSGGDVLILPRTPREPARASGRRRGYGLRAPGAGR